MVRYIEAETAEQIQKAGGSQRRGSHNGSALRRANFHGNAEHRDPSQVCLETFIHGRNSGN